jgi:predicted nucleic acid-binding Zn ribbon protein
MSITRKCIVCGDMFTSSDLRVRKCGKASCKPRQTKWTRVEHLCQVCNQPIPVGSGRRTYCSAECSRLANIELDKTRNKSYRSATHRRAVINEVIAGVKHIIAEEHYTCGECEHIMSYLKGLP